MNQSRHTGARRLFFLALFCLVTLACLMFTSTVYIDTTRHIRVVPHKVRPSLNNMTRATPQLLSNTTTCIEHAATKTTPKKHNNVTNPELSNYRLITPAERITKGSFIHVVIEARSESQQLMPSGGDFWFATMSTNDPHQASTAGRVIDHENGTYSVYFYAAWNGTAEINVTLVHPSKAVECMHDTLWHIGPKTFWSATYKNMTTLSQLKKTNKFDTSCWITRSNDTNTFCEYPSPKGLGNYTFVCEPPEDRRCRPLDIIAVYVSKTNAMTAKSAAGYEVYFQSKYFNKRLTKGPKTIVIKDSNYWIPTSNKEKYNSTLPPSWSYPSHGYWFNYTWTSLLYEDNNWTNSSDMRECLRNKHLMLLGDSTSRQWAENIGTLLGLRQKVHHQEFPNIFFEDDYKEFNLTVSMQFHPQTVTKSRVPFKLYRYFADILDSIQSHECADLIIELSPWAHFAQWTRDSLTQRFIKLREAVSRLRLRCPNVPIIFKGSHFREHDSTATRWSRSDYMLYQIGILMEQIFHGLGIWFLNVWDMNLSFPSRAYVHMPKIVVREELKLAISYICGQHEHGDKY
ncbi:NXPE family member 4-like [Amphiura filiformis]|uniref:NXPE family member 4-like n=1 Tax=Amphiura filiformis TaxID=82378 RepID=UPI003B2170C6